MVFLPVTFDLMRPESQRCSQHPKLAWSQAQACEHLRVTLI